MSKKFWGHCWLVWLFLMPSKLPCSSAWWGKWCRIELSPLGSRLARCHSPPTRETTNRRSERIERVSCMWVVCCCLYHWCHTLWMTQILKNEIYFGLDFLVCVRTCKSLVQKFRLSPQDWCYCFCLTAPGEAGWPSIRKQAVTGKILDEYVKQWRSDSNCCTGFGPNKC